MKIWAFRDWVVHIICLIMFVEAELEFLIRVNSGTGTENKMMYFVADRPVSAKETVRRLLGLVFVDRQLLMALLNVHLESLDGIYFQKENK